MFVICTQGGWSSYSGQGSVLAQLELACMYVVRGSANGGKHRTESEGRSDGELEERWVEINSVDSVDQPKINTPKL